jgi:2-oxo-4-hydroxy-4-carboxy-5-ureidoimidazoline decarboxylase
MTADETGTADATVSVAEFDRIAAEDASELLRPCCASTRWRAALVGARPMHTLTNLSRVSDALIATLGVAELAEALSAHPRIGDRTTGSDRESAWSRREQSATAALPTSVRQQLLQANRAYEQRFDQVFLICATGLSTEQMLQALQNRMANPVLVEQQVVRVELAKIVRLRLAKAFR